MSDLFMSKLKEKNNTYLKRDYFEGGKYFLFPLP
nr:MAG TPA: hypothetical protein [Caudoviricetes sp.]